MDRMETSRVMVGVDVSKAWLDVHLADNKQQFRVANDAKGIAELVERLGGGSGIRVVMEASGGYVRAATLGIGGARRGDGDRQPIEGQEAFDPISEGGATSRPRRGGCATAPEGWALRPRRTASTPR
jgi:hypothetical protein